MPATSTENVTVKKEIPYRAIVLTIYGDIPSWDSLCSKLTYFAYGDETCPTTGRAHKQAFAYSKRAMKFTGWKKLFPNIHFEQMKGNFRQNEKYCSKQSQLVEFGERPNENGKTCGVKRFMEEIIAGEPLRKVALKEEHMETYCRYRNGIKDLISFHQENIINERGFLEPELYVRIGPAGTGKSRWVFDKYGYSNVTTMYPYQGGKFYVPPGTGDCVLFDDVKAGEIIPLALFKQLTDGHPRPVECKGGQVMWAPKVIVFTSQVHPKEWWPNLSLFDIEALERRITDLQVVE